MCPVALAQCPRDRRNLSEVCWPIILGIPPSCGLAQLLLPTNRKTRGGIEFFNKFYGFRNTRLDAGDYFFL